MPRAWACSTLVAGLATCTAVNAHAAPGRFELLWSAPETCPNGAGIERRVAQTLNRPLVVRDDQVLVVRASVTQAELNQTWRVEMETDNGQRRSSRKLEAASCDELAEATALLIAILIEPNVEHSDAMPNVPLPVAPAPVPESERAISVRLGLLAWSGALSGLLPAWSLGLGLGGELAWKALRWHVSVAYWLPVEQPAPDNAAQGARFQLLTTASKLCLAHVLRDVSAGICSGAELAFMSASGFGQGVDSNQQRAQFVSFTAGGLLRWAATPRLTLMLDADALFPLGTRHFVFEGSAPTAIHTPGLGAQLSFGVQFSIGRTGTSALGPTHLR